MSIDSKELLAKLQAEPTLLSWAKLKKFCVNKKKAGVTEDDFHCAQSQSLRAGLFAHDG